MKKITLLFIFLAQIAFSQIPNSLNQKNDKGEKFGFWLVYLTDRLGRTSDSTKAFYFGYIYYDNDYVDLSCSDTGRKAYKIITDGGIGIKGKPVLLNGDFKFYDKKGRLSWEETYKDGRVLMIQAFSYDKKGECSLYEKADYSKRYEDQIGSYNFELYSYSKELLQSKYYRKQDSKWDFWIEKNNQ